MRRAFTLTELLIVIAIIAALAGVAIPVIGIVRKQAKEAGCRNNLKQLYVGITAFRLENNQAFPPGLRTLFEPSAALAGEPMKTAICPFDGGKGSDIHMGRGTGGWWGDLSSLHEQDVTPTSPTFGFASSYLFEASAQPLASSDAKNWTFKNGEPWLLTGSREVWWQAKAYQLRHGDVQGGPMPENRLPIIRCFHHHPWKTMAWSAGPDGLGFPAKVLNIAWDGTQWFSRPYWETDVNPSNLP